MQEPNPDLFFNRATIYEYLERYGEAIRDYNLAHKIDPNLGAEAKAGALINFVVQTTALVQSRQASKAKKNAELAKAVPTSLETELRFPSNQQSTAPVSYKIATIAELGADGNPGAILTARVVMHLEKPNEVPISFLIVDSAQNFGVVSFYQANQSLKETVQPGDLLHVKNPELIFTSLDFKNRMYHYNCIKVANLNDVLHNS